jgi:hypothetical protein
MDEDDEVVNFPVPKRYLPVVILALADAMRDTPATRHKEWTKAEIARLKQELHNRTVLILLDLASERGEAGVDFNEIRQKAGRTQREAMGDLAGFTQLIKRQFGKEGQDDWPVEVKWGASAEESTRYLMQPDIAQWWREA